MLVVLVVGAPTDSLRGETLLESMDFSLATATGPASGRVEVRKAIQVMSVHRTDQPKNLNEVVFVVKGVEVASWTPERDGKGRLTQVHVRFHVQGSENPFVLRYKNRERLQEFIDALIEHRDNVWPGSA